MDICLTAHAQIRGAQRNITPENIDLVLRYGKELHRTGASFIFLGKRDIPEDLRNDDQMRKLEGTVLIISEDSNHLITCYKNRNALREIKKKSKRRRQQPNSPMDVTGSDRRLDNNGG